MLALQKGRGDEPGHATDGHDPFDGFDGQHTEQMQESRNHGQNKGKTGDKCKCKFHGAVLLGGCLSIRATAEQDVEKAAGQPTGQREEPRRYAHSLNTIHRDADGDDPG